MLEINLAVKGRIDGQHPSKIRGRLGRTVLQ